MIIIKTSNEMKAWSQACHVAGGSISFVPTMGNLHAGHLSLVDAANTDDKVVVSIFVNPTQFSADEDLDTYPRTEQNDLKMLADKNVDVVFMPATSEIYPDAENIQYLEVPDLAKELEGASRPEHFRGVATVVKILFDCVEPNHAFFGEKDFQQLVIIKDMVEQLGLDIAIHGEKIIRDDDGLAKSSRNQYLSVEQRQKAPVLYLALRQASKNITQSSMTNDEVVSQSIEFIENNGFSVDYFVIRDASNLGQAKSSNRVILVAAMLGTTRLLDNLRLD